jgi:hypothetical protein
MHVRAHGTVAKFFRALHDATKDQVSKFGPLLKVVALLFIYQFQVMLYITVHVLISWVREIQILSAYHYFGQFLDFVHCPEF